MKLMAMSRHLLVQMDAGEDTFREGGSIVKPETSQRAKVTATVLDVGDAVVLDVEAGSRVVPRPYSGTDLPEELGERLKVVDAADVLLLIEEAEA